MGLRRKIEVDVLVSRTMLNVLKNSRFTAQSCAERVMC